MAVKVGIQLYSVKNALKERPYETLRQVAEAGYRYVEAANHDAENDPGVGFGKSYEQNLAVLNRLEELRVLGLPVLLGASRKSVVGLTLGLPVDERLEGTLATTAIGVLKGAAFIRVHDVRENLLAAKMVLAIRREAGFGG